MIKSCAGQKRYGTLIRALREGRRIVAFEARAWQDDPTKPIASAFGHFMLRAIRGTDEPEDPFVPTRDLMRDGRAD